MHNLNRSEIEVSVRLTDNETTTLFAAMGGYVYKQDENGEWGKVITNATFADTYERCYKANGWHCDATLEFTEADEATIVLALTKFQAAAKADGNRGNQVRATRLFKKVVNAIDDKMQHMVATANGKWINKARSLNTKREVVAAGYKADTFQIVFAENCNRGMISIEQWTDKALAGRNEGHHWSFHRYTHSTEIEANFKIVDGAATTTYTHRKGRWHDDTAVAYDTFDGAMADAVAYLAVRAAEHNAESLANFEQIVAEVAELEQDEALVLQANIVAEADAMLKADAAA